MIGPVRELGAEHQVRERSVINRLDLGERPVMPRHWPEHRPGGGIYLILQRQYFILFFSIAEQENIISWAHLKPNINLRACAGSRILLGKAPSPGGQSSRNMSVQGSHPQECGQRGRVIK
jgi:hypothetical protein